MALTFVKSEFEDEDGDLVPSSWDNQYIMTLTAGKKFGEKWELGIRYQLLGGAPYTPGTVYNSSFVSVYDANQRVRPDYDRLNQKRLADFNRLNFRADPKMVF
ncbi:MAG: hypothetical protein U5L96_05785 [Owenweeksia sp.]|nr:hypothetical protein [Owenweeksia sp.]